MDDVDLKLFTTRHKKLVREFNCGVVSVNSFLQDHALNYGKTGEAKTHLILDKQNKKLIGYFSIKCSSIKIEPPITPHPRMIPAIEISWFGVSIDYQNLGFGKKILSYIIDFINKLKKRKLGVRLITLFAIPNVVNFYEKIGFNKATEDVEIFCNPGNEGCIPMFFILPTS